MLKRIGILAAILTVLMLGIAVLTYKQPVVSNTQPQASVPEPAPAPTPAKPIKVSLSGNNDTASQLIDLRKGLVTFSLTHTGSGSFSIWMVDDNGDKIDLVVNEIGKVSTSHAVKIPADGKYLFDIKADGPWTMEGTQE